MHIIIFIMFDWESLFLFCTMFICLKTLWNTQYKSIFPNFLSPIVWKFWFICNILFIFFISQLPFEFVFLKLLLFCIPLIFTFFLKAFFIFIWKQKFYLQFEFFLNVLISQIKIGTGFRSAFKKAAQSLTHPYFQNYFLKILETISYSQKLREEFDFAPLKQIITELKTADESVQCLEHLENLRHQIYIQSMFRKKVGTALLQIRLQSLVLLLLYSGLFIFILHKYGLKYIKILFISLILFILGLMLLLRCGRKIKWSI